MEKSTHQVEVVKVKLKPHENADNLSLVEIDGYTVVVRTQDWKNGDLGAYIVPDSLVPNTELFSFAFQNPEKDYQRITVKKLRGVYSEGMLVPAPEGAKEGDNVAKKLGVKRYVPQFKVDSQQEPGPALFIPKYDLEAFKKFSRVFYDGEEVIVSEKIHGSNGRYVFDSKKDRMFAGSRTQWKLRSDRCPWWISFNHNQDWIEPFCRANPNIVLFGELYGNVQKLKYGLEHDVSFLAFDVYDPVTQAYLTRKEIHELPQAFKLRFVPTLWIGNFYREKIYSLVDGPSLIKGADHIREGIVISSLHESRLPAWETRLDRKKLKLVSNNYLEGVK